MKQPAEWYDAVYATPGHYRQGYAASPYLPIWREILRRMQAHQDASVVDLGCGPGQFARLLYDNGIKDYRGLDFSQEAIAVARRVCPELTFEVADLTLPGWEDALGPCTTVVATEFLEHIDEDVELLERIPKGKRVYLTVPDFMCGSHVRCFPQPADVTKRYSPLFTQSSVTALKRTTQEPYVFYLFEGIR
jgi:trans-aconitate methyltransferase